MKYKCRISGLEFSDSILSNSLSLSLSPSSSSYLSTHPIFSISAKDLISIASKALQNPKESDLYLIGLAIFNKLSPDWVTSAKPEAIPIITANFERLSTLVFSIPIGRRDEFPRFRIDSSNSDFLNLPTWLDSIQSVFDEWKISGRELAQHRLLDRKEKILVTLLNHRFTKKPSSIAHALAEWAGIAGEFPTSPFYLPDGTKTTTSDYWKTLIKYSFIESHLEFFSLKVDLDDLSDLIDWCEINIPHGSTHASILMSKLRKSKSILEEFTLPKFKSPVLVPELSPISQALKEESSEANTYIPVGPEPKKSDFKSASDYLRAKLKWQTGVIRNRNSMASEL